MAVGPFRVAAHPGEPARRTRRDLLRRDRAACGPIDLDRAKRRGGFDKDFAQQIDKREEALRPVWSELIDRVQALGEVAHVVESAAVELRILDEYNRAATIDDRIDALISRSGDREVSVDNSSGSPSRCATGRRTCGSIGMCCRETFPDCRPRLDSAPGAL